MGGIFIAVLVVSGVAGMKKPMHGAFSGMIVAPIIYYYFHDFTVVFFIILFPAGFLAGWFFGFVANWFFSGFRGGKHNTGPTFRAMPGRPGGEQRGGIMYTDEEEKNARKHKKKIR
jgi:hypothetical protein